MALEGVIPVAGRAVPDRVQAWAQQQVDTEITLIEPLPGGRTHTIHAVHLDHGDPLILRYVPIDTWGETGHRHIVAEAGATALLAHSSSIVAGAVAVPRLIASDPDGSRTGAYVNLISWLSGVVRLDPLGPAAVDELARVATVIHATEVPADRRPMPYAFWAPADLRVPGWARAPQLWERAIEVFAGGPPATPATLVHRDFHPGNVLWEGDRITGVIDWAEASWGPAELDIAHSATNFALLHDLDRAVAFREAYRRHGARPGMDRPEAERAADRFWVLSDILGFLPDPGPIVAALTATRPDLTPDVLRRRLEHLLALTLREV